MDIETAKGNASENGVNAMEHVKMDTFHVELVVAGTRKLFTNHNKISTFLGLTIIPNPTEIAMASAFTKQTNVMANAWMEMKSVEANACLPTAGTQETTNHAETSVTTNSTSVMANVQMDTVLVETINA